MTKAAICAIRRADGKILVLQRRFDDRAYPGGVWCLPGGKLNDGESFEQAVAREVLEETGLNVDVSLREQTVAKSPTNREYELYVYGSERIVSTDEMVTISDEHIAFDWIDSLDGKILTPVAERLCLELLK